MNLLPEGNKVIVKPDTIEEETDGGIIIPDTVRDKRQTAVTKGEIVAMGPLANLLFARDGVEIEVEGEVGQRCIFSKYAGASIRVDRVEYRILFDKNIICLIEGSDEKEIPDSRKSMVE